MKKILKTFVFLAFAALVFSTAAFAQKVDSDEYDVKQIKFARGKTSATVKGVIKDRFAGKQYYVTARAGQTLTVVFSSPRRDVDVCLLMPESRDDICGQRKYSLKVPTDGDYIIMVDGHRENIPFSFTVSIK